MIASTYAEDFCAALNDKMLDHRFEVRPGRTFDKIVRTHRSYGGFSVHAFVVRETGELVKPATAKAPQKDKDGLAVRYRLADPEDAQRAIADADFAGGYLYKRRESAHA